MTAPLPEDVQNAFQSFVTCELTTVDARKQPITWPVTPYYTPGGPTIDVTTGLGYPKKADDAKAHPSVSVLFSDPTGSGDESGIRVLVQGTAKVDDADLKANAERYMEESSLKLSRRPRRCTHRSRCARCSTGTTRGSTSAFGPSASSSGPTATPRMEPQVHDAHLEEVRSGHTEEPPEDHGGPDPGPPDWDRRMEWLAGHEMGVLSWLGPDGFPIAVRVPITTHEARSEIAIEADPAGLPVMEGRACLTVHRHAPDFTWQRNMQVRGDLKRTEGGWWALVPRRIVGGFELPEGRISRFRDFIKKGPGFYRTYRRRMRERT